MPPKQTITQSMVINAAFELIRKNGKSAFSARNIATALSCSTQPIYSCFKTMKDLEEAVIKVTFDFIISTYLSGQTYSDEAFFSMGLGYIQMAKKDLSREMKAIVDEAKLQQKKDFDKNK